MSQSFKCCYLCYQDLESVDGDLAHLWTNLCDKSLDHGGFIEFKRTNEIQEELDELEQLGFLLSHETDTSMITRMEGLFIDDGDDYEMPAFCINFEDHTEEEEM